jgi:hypothetical protein
VYILVYIISTFFAVLATLFPQFWTKHRDHLALRRTLGGRHGLGVDVHGDPDRRVPEQFLDHLHILSVRLEHRGKGVPQRVPRKPLGNPRSAWLPPRCDNASRMPVLQDSGRVFCRPDCSCWQRSSPLAEHMAHGDTTPKDPAPAMHPPAPVSSKPPSCIIQRHVRQPV